MRKIWWLYVSAGLFIAAPALTGSVKASPALTYQGKDYIQYMQEFVAAGGSNEQFYATFSNAPNSNKHIVVACRLARQELGCVPAVLELYNEFLKNKIGSYEGKLTFIISNPVALTRFASPASEENYSYGFRAKQGLEKNRAEEIKTLFKSKPDLFIELSQSTDAHGKTYYSFPYDPNTYEWAKYIQATRSWVLPQRRGLEDPMSLSDYTRSLGIPTITLEINQKDFSDTEKESAFNLAMKAVKTAIQGRARVDDIRDITKEQKLPELDDSYITIYTEPYPQEDLKLEAPLSNFEEIKKGDVLAKLGDSENPLKAPMDGLLLKPKYVVPTPKAKSENAQDEFKPSTKVARPSFFYRLIEKTELKEILK